MDDKYKLSIHDEAATNDEAHANAGFEQETVTQSSKPAEIRSSDIHFQSGTQQIQIGHTRASVVCQAGPPKADKPKDFVIFSCFVILCCNFIFGFLGYNFAVKSHFAWQLGDTDQAKRRARTALIFNVAGVLCGVATYVLVFTLYFTVYKGGVPLLKQHYG